MPPRLLLALLLWATAAHAQPLPRQPQAVRAWLERLAARHPHMTRLVTLGRSHEGRPIVALVLGRGAHAGPLPGPAVLLDGAHHGGELLSIDFVLDAARELLEHRDQDPTLARALEELAIWCVPMVNPDGVHAYLQGLPRSGRKNGRDNDGDGKRGRGDGVDLNRNYPLGWGSLGERGSRSLPASYWYRGPAPASEPETQAIIRLARQEHFVAAIAYHTGTVAVLAPYTIESLPSPEPNEAWMVAEDIVAHMPLHPEGRPFTLRNRLYSVDGTAEDYLRHAHGTVSLLVEGARRPAVGLRAREAVIGAVRPSWRRLLERYLEGPSLEGQVVDAAGQPAVAEVTLAEQQLLAGEHWTSRCRDGRFFRFLPGPGRYTIRARVPGLPEVTQTVEVPSGRGRVKLTLPQALPRRDCPGL
ncbi:MAG: M14 family zinc carboxypeptidase [Myxococcales bacterium]|nr:M14 family zinc carboxypeptidase [Myxococcota bacterium]MDW8280195.1 M14 family zinc carboxypeptidase [Myxococcales bacterium]